MGLQKTKRLFNRKTSIFFWCSQNYKYQNLWTHLRENRMAEEWKPEMLFYILSVNNFYIKLTTKKLFFGNRGKNMEKVRNTTWGKWDKINSFSQKKSSLFCNWAHIIDCQIVFCGKHALVLDIKWNSGKENKRARWVHYLKLYKGYFWWKRNQNTIFSIIREYYLLLIPERLFRPDSIHRVSYQFKIIYFLFIPDGKMYCNKFLIQFSPQFILIKKFCCNNMQIIMKKKFCGKVR